jgi:hypothetical protein
MTKFQTKPYEFKNFKEFSGVTYDIMNEETGEINDMRRRDLEKRHGPSSKEAARYRGVVPYDSRILSAEHLRNPKLMGVINGTGGDYGALLTSASNKTGDGKDTSATPAWRKAIFHFVGMKRGGLNIQALRDFTPEAGSYINEVC